MVYDMYAEYDEDVWFSKRFLRIHYAVRPRLLAWQAYAFLAVADRCGDVTFVGSSRTHG